ncbi:MAG TPA: NAD(P)/FAD-dependent oxidoreductase, partial [Nitrospiraceae bacterium]
MIGAGAAGLAASIFAAEVVANADRQRRIVILDSAKKIGAKILISGGGRCNVTHEVVASTDYCGNRRII